MSSGCQLAPSLPRARMRRKHEPGGGNGCSANGKSGPSNAGAGEFRKAFEPAAIARPGKLSFCFSRYRELSMRKSKFAIVHTCAGPHSTTIGALHDSWASCIPIISCWDASFWIAEDSDEDLRYSFAMTAAILLVAQHAFFDLFYWSSRHASKNYKTLKR